jgi:hypothetical protein
MRCVAGSWITRAATIFQLGFAYDRAGRVDGILKDRPPVGAGRSLGRDSSAALEDDQQVFDCAVAQVIGEDDVVADNLVPFGGHHHDVAVGADFAGLPCPRDLIGGQVVALALHAHATASSYDVVAAVVGYGVRAEFHGLLWCGRSEIGRTGGFLGICWRRERENKRKRGPTENCRFHARNLPRSLVSPTYCTLAAYRQSPISVKRCFASLLAQPKGPLETICSPRILPNHED